MCSKLLTIIALAGIMAIFNTEDPSYAQYPLEGTRRAMYAGTWYEADPARLKADMEELSKNCRPVSDPSACARLSVKSSPVKRPVLAIIAPHAGYVYSGKAAAHAYSALSGQIVKRVFLLGPSHHVPLNGVALPLAFSYETPLGNLPVDKSVVEELKDSSGFVVSPEVHAVEHSLEMQLPFIRETFGEIPIVPMIIGQLPDENSVRMVGQVLKGFIKAGDLVVVSSDFTHYGPRYDYVPFKDNVPQNLASLDGHAFGFIAQRNLPGFMHFEEQTKDTICGFFPCSVLMSMLPEESRATLLTYFTSHDVQSEDRDNSVSYMAIAFSGGNWAERTAGCPGTSDLLGHQGQAALLKLARATLEAHLNGRELPAPELLNIHMTKELEAARGAFVTLYTKPHAHSSTRQLRGCVGYIWPIKPLYETVVDNTISAASKDFRFPKVEPDELHHLEIEISVLTPPRRVASYRDIVLGRDGIVMHKEGRQSVFLPFVPTEFGWDLTQTLTELSKKAGLNYDAWKSSAKFDVFQAQVFEEAGK